MRHPHTPPLSFPPTSPFFAFYRKSAPPIAPDSTSYGPHPRNPADLPQSPAPATASDRSRLPSWPRLSRSSSASHPYPRALCAFLRASSPTGRFATPSKFICPRGGSGVALLAVIRTRILPVLPCRSAAAHHTHWLTSDRLLALAPSGSTPAPLHNFRAGGAGVACEPSGGKRALAPTLRSDLLSPSPVNRRKPASLRKSEARAMHRSTRPFGLIL